MQHDALLPRPPGGLAPGVLLSLLVHGGLVVALTLAVNWHVQAPEVVSAELWSALPQVAAPRVEQAPPPAPAPAPAPPPPAPTPAPPPKATAAPDPQIAIARAEQKRLEHEQEVQAQRRKAEDKKRAAAEAAAEQQRVQAQHAAEQKALAKAAAAEQAKAREAQLQRMLGALPSQGNATGTAARDSAPSQTYIGRLRRAVRDSVTFSAEGLAGNPTAEVEVRATPSGTILSSRLVKSSGVPEWDRAVMRGIGRLGSLPLPRANEGRIPEVLLLELRPKEE